MPSTHDLLTAQGLDPAVLRKRAGALAASMRAKNEDYEAGSSPRSDATDAVITSFHVTSSERLSMDQ